MIGNGSGTFPGNINLAKLGKWASRKRIENSSKWNGWNEKRLERIFVGNSFNIVIVLVS